MRKKALESIFLLAGFVAGIYHGQLALWRGEDPEPELILPYSAALFPPEDQQALQQGIRLPDDAALSRFMEDFCS